MGPLIGRICIVVLAAGRSARLGRPKQLLSFEGGSLVQHAVSVALSSGLGPVLVVTGANQEAVESELRGQGIHTSYNPDWEEGMGASIRHGVDAALELDRDTDGLIFMVCDQPYITASLLQHLLETQHETGRKIVASEYGGIRGTPALYHASLFEELKALTGDKGARSVLARHEGDIATIPFGSGAMDIDTEADYENLTMALNKKKT
jgi:molybdenum cofactor cytidylyltransferase